MIGRGVTEGAFRTVDVRVAALGILGTVNWVAWWFDPDHNDNLDAISHQLADTAVAGLLDVSSRQPVDGPDQAIAAIRAQPPRTDVALLRTFALSARRDDGPSAGRGPAA
ncbi:hypothetical protein GKO32_13235 [Amycolatopsis sp. RM579]|uniref:HTH-type transcriptional repressor KstR2 C-terminal domain-containing protein n=1 Tax=Amycolatopsis pithecellobii TaxID=664692 RepID=A0A6N7Z406_9PSEU|nr:hypothetical protein [Amycolatopsis pithecellobii]